MAFDLSSLLKDVPDLGTGREQIEYIQLNKLDEDPNNFYQLSNIPELAANIQLCGLQQPIRVRATGNGRYQIVSGHRRRAAVAMLAEEDPQKWEEVACIVQQGNASSSLQQLQLIFANANTRKMTDAEIAEQAAQIKTILYRMKEEEGFEFPGRMRDYVAEIVKISKSKLSRLEAIENNLAEEWTPAWKSGNLSENAAYELSKLAKWLQHLYFQEKERTNANLKYLYADDVKRFSERTAAIQQMQCDDGFECRNCENKLRKAAVADRYGWFHCDSKCCKDCPELLRCQKACPKLKDLIREGKETAKQSQREAEQRQAERDRPGAEFAKLVYDRIGQARKQNGVSVEQLYKAQQKMYSATIDDSKQKTMESGKGKYGPNTDLPFGWSVKSANAMKMVAVADTLGCSIDYLLGRTDLMEVAHKED